MVQVVQRAHQDRVAIPVAAGDSDLSTSNEDDKPPTPTSCGPILAKTSAGNDDEAIDTPARSMAKSCLKAVQALEKPKAVQALAKPKAVTKERVKKNTLVTKKPKSAKKKASSRKPVSRGNDADSTAEDGDCEADGEAGETSTTRQKRMVYRAKENCLVMQEVLGDNGIFNRGKKESKADCWVKITEHLTEVLNKKINPDSLRKHINKLEKTYKKEANADRARSGQEPVKDADEQELERLMCRYVGLKDAEDSEKAERTESRNKKAEADRIGGAAIRDAAVSVERPHKKKSSASKRLDPLAFLKALKDDMKSEREEENRRRDNNEGQTQLRLAQMEQNNAAMMLQVSKVFEAILTKAAPTAAPTASDD